MKNEIVNSQLKSDESITAVNAFLKKTSADKSFLPHEIGNEFSYLNYIYSKYKNTSEEDLAINESRELWEKDYKEWCSKLEQDQIKQFKDTSGRVKDTSTDENIELLPSEISTLKINFNFDKQTDIKVNNFFETENNETISMDYIPSGMQTELANFYQDESELEMDLRNDDDMGIVDLEEISEDKTSQMAQAKVIDVVHDEYDDEDEILSDPNELTNDSKIKNEDELRELLIKLSKENARYSQINKQLTNRHTIEHEDINNNVVDNSVSVFLLEDDWAAQND